MRRRKTKGSDSDSQLPPRKATGFLMRKGLNRNILKIVAATSVVLFSLMAAFAGSIAWFNAAQALSNRGSDMSVGLVGNLESIDVYTTTSADADGYIFSSTPVQQIRVTSWADGHASFEARSGESAWASYASCPAINMNPNIVIGNDELEDPFSPLSPFHPLMLICTYRDEIDATEESVRIYAETSHAFLADAVTPSGSSLPGETIRATGNPLSSFIQAYSKGYDSSTSVPFSYEMDDLSSMQHGTFASLNGEGTPTFNANPTFFYDDEHDVKKVAIIFEYNIPVIEYIYFRNLGLSVLDDVITATCDWRLYV